MICKKNLFKMVLPALALFFGANLVSCSNDDPIIGSDLLSKDKIQVKSDDGFTIKAYTQSQNGIPSSGVSRILAGNINSEEYGHTNAGFAVQFRMPYSVEFNDNATVDSVRVYLRSRSFVGDSLTPQKVHLYELAESLDSKATYQSNFDITSILGGELTEADMYYPKMKIDTIAESGSSTKTLFHLLEFKLPNSFGERFLQTDKENLSDQEHFLQFFKGIYVSADPISADGAIYPFDPSYSTMVLFYKNNAEQEEDETDEQYAARNKTIRYDFRISDNSARVNLFSHDATGSMMAKSLDNETVADTVVYVKGLAGSKAKILIPEINDFSRYDYRGKEEGVNPSTLKGKIAINRAELQLFVASDTFPSRMLLRTIDEDGEEQPLPEDEISTILQGGFYDKETKSYRFNISTYLQQIIEGETENHGFVLVSAQGNIDARSAIIYAQEGGIDKEKQMKFSVTYTKL